MVKQLLLILITFLSVSGQQQNYEVHQSPSDQLRFAGESTELHCNHSVSAFSMILWYQKPLKDFSLNLIAYVYYKSPTVESSFMGHFNVSGDGEKHSTLHLLKLRAAEDSAVYYCAASGGGRGQAYFGGGTKLTVLEKGRSAESPKVEILNVSSTEVCNKEAVTLVCLASKFYPDHVSVSWDMNGEEMGNVATDNAATRDDKYYSISSRLQIPYQTWTTGKTFTCTVKFFNGTGYENHPASIRGPVDSGRNEAATFVKSGKTTMLAYGMIIVKSVIYGIFIIVVIKKQDFRGK